jgi:hypothetical protein
MRFSKWLLFLLFCILISPKSVPAQGCFGMIPSYSSYFSYSADANYIYSGVTVDGTTTGNTQCGAMHRGQAYNMLGSTGGWSYGGFGPAASYIFFMNNQQIAVGQPGVVYEDDYIGQIDCTIAGIFYSAGGSVYFEGASTHDKATDGGTYEGTFAGEPVYRYNVVHFCDNGTPDYNPPYLDDNNAHAATDRYFLGLAVLFRLTKTSTWSVLWPTGYATVNGGPPPQPYPPNLCTHTGPQQ